MCTKLASSKAQKLDSGEGCVVSLSHRPGSAAASRELIYFICIRGFVSLCRRILGVTTSFHTVGNVADVLGTDWTLYTETAVWKKV